MDYIHVKTGNVYQVLGTVVNATNGENDGQTMIMYRRKSDPRFKMQIELDTTYVREVSEFNEKFIKKENE